MLRSILITLPLLLSTLLLGQPTLPAQTAQQLYTYSQNHHPDGIGKFYCGREISHVMGHAGIAWLERPEREREEQPQRLVPLLKIQPGQTIADIGAGSGYHTRRYARAVGQSGKVYAVDIQPEMITALQQNARQLGLSNVIPTLGTITDPKLPPNSIDLAVMVDVYHEFSHPHEMIQSICAALKPGGRIAFVEFRANDPTVPIKPLHTMSADQVRKEMQLHPLEWTETITSLPWQSVIVFRKKTEPAQ